MPAEGRHLLADDDLDRQPPVAGDAAPRHGGIDPLVIGDGDDVELADLCDALDDRDHVGDPVRGDGVDVQVGATAPIGHAGLSRSGQIGKNVAHHCSGASAMTSSKARAIAAVVAVARSRREPSVGTATGSSRPM